MKIGYARVSTQDQNLDLQIDALKKEGCEMIFMEKISGKTKDRPELKLMFSKLRKGDTVVVWRLDRLGRSLQDLIYLITEIGKSEANFHSIQNSMDSSTATGRLIFNVFGALAEFESDLISERTKAGLAAARARGKKGGRPPGFTKDTISKIKAVKVLYDEQDKGMKEIANDLSISRASAYRFLNTAKQWELEKSKSQ